MVVDLLVNILGGIIACVICETAKSVIRRLR